MDRSKGRLTVVLVLAAALAGCQPVMDSPAPSPPVDDTGANGADMKEAAKLPSGEANHIGILPDDYFKVKEMYERLGDHVQKLLQNDVARAVDDFRSDSNDRLWATLEGVRKVKEAGYDLAPLCEPYIIFIELNDLIKEIHYLPQLYQAGQNEFEVKFNHPDLGIYCHRQDEDIEIYVNYVAARIRKKDVQFSQNIELHIKKEVLLIYYIIDGREKSLAKGAFIYSPPGEEGARTFNLTDDSESIKAFEGKSVTVPMWEVIKHYINNRENVTEGNGKSEVSGDLHWRTGQLALTDMKRAVTCLDTQNPKTATRYSSASGHRIPMQTESSPSELMQSVVYIYNPKGADSRGTIGTGFYARLCTK